MIKRKKSIPVAVTPQQSEAACPLGQDLLMKVFKNHDAIIIDDITLAQLSQEVPGKRAVIRRICKQNVKWLWEPVWIPFDPSKEGGCIHVVNGCLMR